MANVVQLNKAEHKNLKVIRERSAEFGDNVMMCMTFPLEFRSVQTYYPILFKNDSEKGDFFAVALFGFEEGENLYLTEKGWAASYIPLMMERQPFLIGVQKADAASEEEDRRVIHIDMDDKRVNAEKGEPLFTELGVNSKYLERTAAVLETIHQWNIGSEKFMRELAEHELLESVTIDVTLDDGSKGQLLGFYTISEEKLSTLSDEIIASLHKQNYLQPIYMAMASLSNIKKLRDLKSEIAGSLPEYM